ncbi:hypothetical protein HYPSUDRAFT_59307 [Hypholoma sublateritium FD-334 SS-4]|uniref:Mid2 domain-containing protein n=1 Tax=Hypholoma sublateritium (strain FD-334 SS-4) TaxID=945553 RepID=A0A0D2KIS9_HYPSF|nr:hypothetical protein HYPSUDRAFT_59307 [Hypholoma sublateritium FD-334 SS-4]
MPSSHFPYGTQLFLITLILRSAHAYTLSFNEAPSQCGQVIATIARNDGAPPFRLLIVPFGSSPLPNGVETRSALDVPFSGNASQVQFQLTYPAGSQFVAVVSDASGFASVGTTAPILVDDSNDNSCFNATAPALFDFSFVVSTTTPQIVQCQTIRVWWDPTTVQGTPNFLGIVPGGQSQSYDIAERNITTVPNMGTGFSFLVNMRAGTTCLLMGGDGRGNGTGGTLEFIVALGNDDESCLSNTSPTSTLASSTGITSSISQSTTTGSPVAGSVSSNSPSSTSGSPTGGSVSTGTGWAGGDGRHSTSGNVGTIVGGAVGGFTVALVISLVLIYFLRRRNQKRGLYRDRRVGAIDDDDAGDSEYPAGVATQPNELLEYYQPEPLVLGADDEESAGGQTPLETVGESFSVQGGDKYRGEAPAAIRVLKYIQHDDAGPSIPVSEASEMVEIPPSYVDLRRSISNAARGKL